MPLYKDVVIAGYNEEFKAVVTLGKNNFTLPGYIINEKINIETSFQHNQEKIMNIKLVTPSKYRVKPQCEIYNKCGGCAIQHIEYLEQLKLKTEMIKKLFKNKLKYTNEISPIIGMKVPYHYRSKSQIVFKYQKGKMISGFYEEGSHDVIDFDHCYLQNEECNKIIKTAKELMVKMRISAYDEDRHTGLIRHILIKTVYPNNDVLVVLVTSNANFPGRNNFVKALVSRHPTIKTIIQNINTRKTSAVLGEQELVLYGKGYIIDNLLGLKFKITSKSFYQINHQQTEKLYSSVLELADIKPTDTVVDAYCGVGTIGLFAALGARKVIGVEVVKDAVDNAIFNAKLNNIKNIHFFAQDATDFIINMARRKEKIDILVMDPPRSGSTHEFLTSILKLKPSKIVYVSCNPYTLVEDIQKLTDAYEIKTVKIIDMFPHTFHVESITLLELKKE